MFCTSSRDLTIKIWQPTSNNSVATLKGHSMNIPAIDLSINDELCSGSRDYEISFFCFFKKFKLIK